METDNLHPPPPRCRVVNLADTTVGHHRHTGADGGLRSLFREGRRAGGDDPRARFDRPDDGPAARLRSAVLRVHHLTGERTFF